MLLITLSWIYIIFSTINLGFGLVRICNLKINNFAIISILGLFSVTILASFWAIFGRINIEFNCFLLFLNILIFTKFNANIVCIYRTFFLKLKKLKPFLRFYLLLITCLIIAQCAVSPFVIDNESYYIQTIKWLNKYGFVKGLANLHIFLAQTSGWHIAQSVFNFSFLYKDFNDLSGFILWLGNIFAVFKLNTFYKNNNKIDLLIGLFPLINVFFFLFISAPSPDIAVYVLTFIIFYYFIKNFKSSDIKNINLIVILVLFSIYIKISTVFLIVLPLILFIKKIKKLKVQIYKSIILTTVVVFLFITKNSIVTGFPFFPSTHFFGTNFAIPNEIIQNNLSSNKLFYFFIKQSQIHSLNNFQLFQLWFFHSKINAVLSLFGFIVFAICPYFIKKYCNEKSIWILYLVSLFQIIAIIFISPQYRFYVQYVLFFGLFIISFFVTYSKTIYYLLFASTIPIIILLFIPLNFSFFTKNKLISNNTTFDLSELVFPNSNSKINCSFHKNKIGNLECFSPSKNVYFWNTGNGNLPCVNQQQINFYSKKFKIIPQMRTNNLKDGFYSKKIVQ